MMRLSKKKLRKACKLVGAWQDHLSYNWTKTGLWRFGPPEDEWCLHEDHPAMKPFLVHLLRQRVIVEGEQANFELVLFALQERYTFSDYDGLAIRAALKVLRPGEDPTAPEPGPYDPVGAAEVAAMRLRQNR